MRNENVQKITLSKFTAFDRISIPLSRGINIFIGENSTGKTHILKILYSVLSAAYKDLQNRLYLSGDRLAEKIINVFLPYKRRLGRLVHRQKGGATAKVEIKRANTTLMFEFTNQSKNKLKRFSLHRKKWSEELKMPVYIPSKEILTNAPGFLSLYETREVFFEEVYKDLVLNAYHPVLRGPKKERQNQLLRIIDEVIQGKVILRGEYFFLKDKHGDLEFTLLAEGICKLALIWRLIQNGSLLTGSTLMWDEPEANLNPSLLDTVVKILLELQREGMQIFLATHNYVLLKEFDLHVQSHDNVVFHSLYRDKETGQIRTNSTENYLEIDPNVISKTYLDLYEKELERNFETEKEKV